MIIVEDLLFFGERYAVLKNDSGRFVDDGGKINLFFSTKDAQKRADELNRTTFGEIPNGVRFQCDSFPDESFGIKIPKGAKSDNCVFYHPQRMYLTSIEDSARVTIL